MNFIIKNKLKFSLLLAIASVAFVPQRSQAIELVPILDKVAKNAVEGAIKGFFGIDSSFDFNEDYDSDEYEDYEDYEDYDDYENYDEDFSQEYHPGYASTSYVPSFSPGYGYYPGYPSPPVYPVKYYPNYPLAGYMPYPGYLPKPSAFPSVEMPNSQGYSVPNAPNNSGTLFLTN